MPYIEHSRQMTGIGVFNPSTNPRLTHHDIAIECSNSAVTFTLQRTVVGLSATFEIEDGAMAANSAGTFVLPGTTQLIITPSDLAEPWSLSMSSY